MVEGANLSTQPIVVVWCVVQAIFSFGIISLISSEHRLVPFKGSLPEWAHAGLRFLVALGWLGVLFGAVLSGSSIALNETSAASTLKYAMQNDLGVYISRFSGAIAIPHAFWVLYRLYELLQLYVLFSVKSDD